MYGKDFHQWREAQKIIAAIEAEEPEVKAMVRERYRKIDLVRFPSAMPSNEELLRQQYYRLRHDYNSAPLGGLFGGLLS